MSKPVSRPAPLGRRILSAFAGITAAALLALGAWQGYREVIAQPFAHVVFAGDLDRLPHRDLEALTRSIQAAMPGQSTLEDVREAARRVPWVREATVRRRYPGTVEIQFVTHRAIARWNEAQLVSPEGAVFTAEEPAALPRFRGPDGNAPDMAREYSLLAAVLAPLESPIAELRLSARGAWQVALQSGLMLDLGRGEATARAERFAAAWPQLVAQGLDAKQVDLRYPNGFAVRARLTGGGST